MPHTSKMIISVLGNIWHLSAGKKINFILHIFLELLFYCKDIMNLFCFGCFGHARLWTRKVILSIYRKHSGLTAGKKNQLHPPCFSEDWLSAFWPITWEPEFFQIRDWWWNINNNISFHFRLFRRKTNNKIFQKILKNLFGGQFGSFLLKFGQKCFLWERELCLFLNIPITFFAT